MFGRETTDPSIPRLEKRTTRGTEAMSSRGSNRRDKCAISFTPLITVIIVGIASLLPACSSSSSSTTPPSNIPTKLFVADEGGGAVPADVRVFPISASGNVAPTATISGAMTGLVGALDMARDGAGNIYVSDNTPSIRVFAPTASGNVAPTRVIAGPATTLSTPIGMGFDAAGNLYVADFSGGGGVGSIALFAAGANGNIAPIATISGASTGLNGAEGLALDGSGRIWVVNQNAPNVEAFAPGSNGNVAPAITIAGVNTGMTLATRPGYLALDSAGNIYVSIFAANTINVFAASASGNVAPIRSISGASTSLTFPLGVLVDPAGKLYVANNQGPFITEYAAGANGNVAPVVTISGAATGFDFPIGLSF